MNDQYFSKELTEKINAINDRYRELLREASGKTRVCSDAYRMELAILLQNETLDHNSILLQSFLAGLLS